MKTRNRGYKIAIILLMSVMSFVLLTVFGLIIYTKKNIDFDADEKLFLSSRAENVTRFYYDGSGKYGTQSSEYIPCELESLTGAVSRRKWTSLSDINDTLINAFIATEDRTFYEHNGINFKRTFSAVLNQLFHFKSSFGGSTITQQLIKNMSGDNERTIKRKLNELIRAYHLEYAHSKDEILELYLNIIPLGEKSCGVGCASEVYFGKEAKNLSIEESATLVALANAPSRYNPYTNYDGCLEKRNVIISSMLECGYITNEEYERAIAEPIKLNKRTEQELDINSWFVEAVCDELVFDLMERYGYSQSTARFLILNGGLSVYTTIDIEAQNILEEYFESADNFPRGTGQGFDFSMVICDSVSADLRAIVGGVGKKRANRILNQATALHRPGSTLKPLALYAPLINSKEITYSTVFDDTPVRFFEEGYEKREYPKNSPAVYDGLIPVSNALAYSKNTVAIRLYNMLGKERIYSHLKEDYGFNSIVYKRKLHNGRVVSDLYEAPLALGQLSYGISLRQLTEAYTVFPSEGVIHSGRSYIKCIDNEGQTLIEKEGVEKRVYSPEASRLVNKMLERVVDIGTAKGITLKNLVDTAGKTGTTSQSKDKLFVGYTPYYTAGIWSGTVGSSSIIPPGQTHIKVWDNVMHLLHECKLEFFDEQRTFSTDGLVYRPFCLDSGKIPCEKCLLDPRGDRIAYGYFMKDTEPKEECDRHILCDYDILKEGIAVNQDECDAIKQIALLYIPERSFPKQVYITDAEYAYRDVTGVEAFPDSDMLPYFMYALPDGEYVGITKGKRQFNCANN